MKRSVHITPDNVADGVNQLLLILDAADAEALALAAGRLDAFADLLRRLGTAGTPAMTTPAPVGPPASAAPPPEPPGKAPPPVPRVSPGAPNPAARKPSRARGEPIRAREIALLLAGGPKTSGELARELGVINQSVDGPLRRSSAWFEKEYEGTGPRDPSRWRLSPAGHEMLRSLPPAATSPRADSRADSASPPGTGPAT